MKLSDLKLLPSPLPDVIVFSLFALVRAIFYITLTANVHATDATLERMQGTDDAGLEIIVEFDAELERHKFGVPTVILSSRFCGRFLLNAPAFVHGII